MTGPGDHDDEMHPFGPIDDLLDDPLLSRFVDDARVQPIYGGTNEIMKEIVGRSLGV